MNRTKDIFLEIREREQEQKEVAERVQATKVLMYLRNCDNVAKLINYESKTN